jgi:hypothetical protein
MRIELKSAEGYDPDQPRDESGRWTSGGGGGSEDKVGGQRVGTQKYPAERTATLKRLSWSEFKKFTGSRRAELTKTIGRVIKSTGGNTLPGIYAYISQAYGVAPGPAMGKIIDTVLKDMYKDGLISVEKTTIQGRHGKDARDKLTQSGKPKEGTQKYVWDQIDNQWKPIEIEQFQISLTPKALSGEFKNLSKLDTPMHTLGTTRPDRFEPVKGSQVEQSLNFRRETFDDTRLSPMGRYFSSNKEAPEMMLGSDREKLFKDGKISRAELNAKEGTKIGGKNGKYIREEFYKDKSFYDATSSVTGHIGTMTNDEISLKMSRLLHDKNPPPQHQTMIDLGIKAKDTSKPYYSTFVGVKKEDFVGIDPTPEQIKTLAKSLWTPGSYGSPPGAMHRRLEGELIRMGMKPSKEPGGEATKALRTKLIDNFKASSMYNFTKEFKGLIQEAPDNFVYTNPMSGFRMSFNEFDIQRHQITLGENVVRVSVPTQIARQKVGTRDDNGNFPRKAGSAAPLFIQNWDAAVIGQLMKDLKSPLTAHDAIGFRPAQKDDMHKSVVAAMNRVKELNPLRDLANQIIKQHEKNGLTGSKLKAKKEKINAYVNRLIKPAKIPTFIVDRDAYGKPTDSNHFDKEF